MQWTCRRRISQVSHISSRTPQPPDKHISAPKYASAPQHAFAPGYLSAPLFTRSCQTHGVVALTLPLPNPFALPRLAGSHVRETTVCPAAALGEEWGTWVWDSGAWCVSTAVGVGVEQPAQLLLPPCDRGGMVGTEGMASSTLRFMGDLGSGGVVELPLGDLTEEGGAAVPWAPPGRRMAARGFVARGGGPRVGSLLEGGEGGEGATTGAPRGCSRGRALMAWPGRQATGSFDVCKQAPASLPGRCTPGGMGLGVLEPEGGWGEGCPDPL